ncbi:MAG: 50S ribosomal protein L15 [Thermovirgaceae bacterium]|nr:50S ribosomal protein L15 [Synergistales bacterium]MDI9392707.1 50S ribosomal protein L15 [Synergistota bacterium]MDY0178959.1 50S ribosomal protein L15 [Synergistaceae bacterium]HRW87927.1 50S ribosomal protein L15 [Thermovirgaceae bacterium]MDD3133386.1 50S ribosomal protein L15 [Synergistales bacterium]
MGIHELRPAPGSKKKPKRLGQGVGTGKGKTAGKGNKGQKARSGGGVRPGFEGGQMPLSRRTPKRGFSNARFKKTFQLVNVERLEELFENGSKVGIPEMIMAGLVRSGKKPVKVLGDGEVSKALTVKANAFSAQAVAKIEAAGGKTEVI